MKWILKVPLFWVLFGWVILPIWLIYRILMALLGFWKCEKCKIWFWVKTEKCIYDPGFRQYHMNVCPSCHEVLVEEATKWRKMIQPPKSPKALFVPSDTNHCH